MSGRTQSYTDRLTVSQVNSWTLTETDIFKKGQTDRGQKKMCPVHGSEVGQMAAKSQRWHRGGLCWHHSVLFKDTHPASPPHPVHAGAVRKITLCGNLIFDQLWANHHFKIYAKRFYYFITKRGSSLGTEYWRLLKCKLCLCSWAETVLSGDGLNILNHKCLL